MGAVLWSRREDIRAIFASSYDLAFVLERWKLGYAHYTSDVCGVGGASKVTVYSRARISSRLPVTIVCDEDYVRSEAYALYSLWRGFTQARLAAPWAR